MRHTSSHPPFVYLGKEVLDKKDRVVCTCVSKAMAQFISDRMNEAVQFRKVKRLLAL